MSRSLKYISVEGSAIGLVGIRLLMNANNNNPNTEFQINSKNCGSEMDAAADSQVKLFSQKNPEGPYKLDLTRVYDQIVLQKLLSLSHGLAA